MSENRLKPYALNAAAGTSGRGLPHRVDYDGVLLSVG
jgi:hypothetical protein